MEQESEEMGGCLSGLIYLLWFISCFFLWEHGHFLSDRTVVFLALLLYAGYVTKFCTEKDVSPNDDILLIIVQFLTGVLLFITQALFFASPRPWFGLICSGCILTMAFRLHHRRHNYRRGAIGRKITLDISTVLLLLTVGYASFIVYLWMMQYPR